MRAPVAAALLLVACSGGRAGIGGGPPDGSVASDAPGGNCSLALVGPPTEPQVGVDEAIRVSASLLGVSGVVTYVWTATLDGAPTEADPAQPDDSAIDIPVVHAGTVHVTLSLPDHPECLGAATDITVLSTTLATASYRLRVAPPPASGLPTTDQIITVHAGVDTVLPVALATGVTVSSDTVVDGSGAGVPAYVRLTPIAAPDSAIEAYANGSGQLPELHVLGQQHSALVVPTDPALAPRVSTWTPGQSAPFTVTGGTPVTGTVRDPSGAPLAGASVVLAIDGTPSSVGVTNSSGAFTLHATPVAGATIAITVAPPAASGLPRLVASSQTIALGAPWTIAYAATLATRDLSGVHVTRGGSPVANAHATVVGTLATAGTITAGAVSVPAAGDVRIALATDGAGALAGRAPAAPLSLVVARGGTDVALAAFDLTASAPAQVATSAPVSVTGTLSLAGAPAAGVRAAAVGTGALAGIEVQVPSDGGGAFALPLAAGGAYQLRFVDPANRAAPLAQTVASATAGSLGALALPASVHLVGTVTVSGTATALGGTSVQLLCVACTGADATVPIAEAATDGNGRYRLAAPDPSAAR